MANDKYKPRVGINVIEKVISLKEQDQEFLTVFSIDFIRDLCEREFDNGISL